VQDPIASSSPRAATTATAATRSLSAAPVGDKHAARACSSTFFDCRVGLLGERGFDPAAARRLARLEDGGGGREPLGRVWSEQAERPERRLDRARTRLLTRTFFRRMACLR